MRIFLDANVLFSAALNIISGLRGFFSLVEAGVCELLASPFALDDDELMLMSDTRPVKSA